jgi:hypothetical protein
VSAVRRLPLVAIVVLSACRGAGGAPPGASSAETTEDGGGPAAITRVTCGDAAFDIAVLDQPGGAEDGDDPAAVALREHLASGMETEFLPADGWIAVARTDSQVVFLAPSEGGYANVSMELTDGGWRARGWGGCPLQPEVAAGMGLATYRVAPDERLTPDTTEVDVLVTEIACNSGEDARGRVQPPAIIRSPESLTVIFTVVARPGGHDCPSNPPTPFHLVLPEPLGERALLDGSHIPARDATECEPNICP